MHHYDQAKVRCPFYREHILPLNTASYHCHKCEAKYLAEKPGHRVYHCKYNYMHIFLSETAHAAHETSAVCKKGVLSQTFEPFVEDEAPRRTTSKKRKSAEYFKRLRQEEKAA